MTGPVVKHFGNLESYQVHNQIRGLVLIESKSLVVISNQFVEVILTQSHNTTTTGYRLLSTLI